MHAQGPVDATWRADLFSEHLYRAACHRPGAGALPSTFPRRRLRVARRGMIAGMDIADKAIMKQTRTIIGPSSAPGIGFAQCTCQCGNGAGARRRLEGVEN